MSDPITSAAQHFERAERLAKALATAQAQLAEAQIQIAYERQSNQNNVGMYTEQLAEVRRELVTKTDYAERMDALAEERLIEITTLHAKLAEAQDDIRTLEKRINDFEVHWYSPHRYDALRARLAQCVEAMRQVEYTLRCHVLPNTGMDDAHEAHRKLKAALDAQEPAA